MKLKDLTVELSGNDNEDPRCGRSFIGPALLPAGFKFVEGKGFGTFVGHISGETPESGLESPDL